MVHRDEAYGQIRRCQKSYYKRMDVQPSHGVHSARCVLDATAPSVLAVPMFTHKSVSTFWNVLLLC